jgi:hypothetical protein
MAAKPVPIHGPVPKKELQHRLLGHLRVLLRQVEPGPDQPSAHHEGTVEQDDRGRLDQ